ncbi:MAG: BolA family transcriptional regulator [Acidiferrobacteraceae bacterium]|mgnify:FL=1|jgi:acid stress-induced BolA-like protein IbaG/YrbA|nr:BolA family transcriptional regulator [Acidiferrobacteraceae bacterium]MDP6123174.1 BolA/IbaG family iron-sulfur metabolism protein [Arenicellales bacterium]MDP6435000.1 BolA/IbaG family iron-sulfur metabolism protein [Arenicellales bacterium]MDP6672570.1 BolA/IbaG family iron-sulfur metabolism protein [Arenicellales bacterium]MDP6724990.1 BolA/IbaG family iron-sulfur metabolism protein [Arenicellales bacterium]|tara:strand:- start:243 stop:467 length:225 start_codon:yes stop_codon:yes gene_type:complete
MVTPEEIKTWIEEKLESAVVEVEGDGQHFYATVSSPDFAGKSMVVQHQMVYAALGDKMKADIHALSMKTVVPGE